MMQKALVLLVSFAVTALCLFTPASADRVPFTRGRYGDVWDTLVDPFKILDSIPKDIEAVALTRVDWKETTDAHVFTVDVPGMKKDDIKIEVEDNRVLIISGERRKEKEEEGYKWHRVERSSGKFWRQFRLPENVNMDAIRASLDNGVLTVAVPKISDFKGKEAKVIDGVLTVAVPKTNDFKGKNIDIVENKVTKFGRRNSKIRLSGSIRSNCSQFLLEKDARIDIIENKATQFGRIGAQNSKIVLSGSIQKDCTDTTFPDNTMVITTTDPCLVNSISVVVHSTSTT